MTSDADWFRTQCQIHRSIEDEMLALIERQAAEIVELTKANAQLFEHGKTMYAERERLRAAAAPPHEPTQAMLNAGRDVLYIYERALPRLEMAHDVWCAMYDAAPIAAPVPISVGEFYEKLKGVDAAINTAIDAARAGRASK